MSTYIITWNEQPDPDKIDRAVANLTTCQVRAIPVYTGSDQHALVFTDEDHDAVSVRAAYEAWLRDGTR